MTGTSDNAAFQGGHTPQQGHRAGTRPVDPPTGNSVLDCRHQVEQPQSLTPEHSISHKPVPTKSHPSRLSEPPVCTGFTVLDVPSRALGRRKEEPLSPGTPARMGQREGRCLLPYSRVLRGDRRVHHAPQGAFRTSGRTPRGRGLRSTRPLHTPAGS